VPGRKAAFAVASGAPIVAVALEAFCSVRVVRPSQTIFVRRTSVHPVQA
jgi:hypothetical protein